MANRAARVIERLSREADHKEPSRIDPGIVGLERRHGPKGITVGSAVKQAALHTHPEAMAPLNRDVQSGGCVAAPASPRPAGSALEVAVVAPTRNLDRFAIVKVGVSSSKQLQTRPDGKDPTSSEGHQDLVVADLDAPDDGVLEIVHARRAEN